VLLTPVHSSPPEPPQPTHLFFEPSISTWTVTLEQKSHEVEVYQVGQRSIEQVQEALNDHLEALVKNEK